MSDENEDLARKARRKRNIVLAITLGALAREYAPDRDIPFSQVKRGRS